MFSAGSVLPPMTKVEGETVEDFTRRVQSFMADSLHVVATSFNSADKAELITQKLDAPHQCKNIN